MPTVELAGNGILDLVWKSGPVAKAVLGILLLFSVVSWGLILEKWWQFRRARRQTLEFLRVFRDGRGGTGAHATARRLRESPLARLHLAAQGEFSAPEGLGSAGARSLGAGDLEQVERALRRAAGTEVARLERYLPFLATTASSTPFIGLFGTVWGIMAAFHGIGQQGSASLAVVAPGISEALVATAAGLGAAIPAVIAYNYFVNRVRHWSTEMDGFSLDLLNLAARPAGAAAGSRHGA